MFYIKLLVCVFVICTVNLFSSSGVIAPTLESIFQDFDQRSLKLLKEKKWKELEIYSKQLLLEKHSDEEIKKVRLNLTISQVFLNKNKEALEALKPLTKTDGPIVWNNYGLFFDKLRRHSFAQLCYLEAAKLNHIEAQRMVGINLLRGQVVSPNCKEALKWFKKAVALKDVESLGLLGLANLGNFTCEKNQKEANRYFTLGAKKNDLLSIRRLADSYLFGLGVKVDRAKASKLLEQAVALNDAKATYRLGNMYKKDGKIKEALKLWKTAAQQGNTPAMNNYAYVSAQQKTDLDNALYYAVLASKKDSKNIGIFDTIAWVLVQKERWCEAKFYMDKLSGSYASNKELNDHQLHINKSIKKKKISCPSPLVLEKIDHGLAATVRVHASILYNLGYYNHVEKILSPAVESEKNSIITSDKRILSSRAILGNAYREQGKLEAALLMFQKNLSDLESFKLGESLDALTMCNNIGGVYSMLKHYKLAEQWHERALKGLIKLVGPNDQNTLVTMNNIASVSEHLGDHEKSIEMCKKILKIKKESIGENHVSYAKTLLILSAAYLHTKKIKEAIDTAVQASEIFEKTMGDMHPMTLGSYLNLIGYYLGEEDYKNANTYLLKAKLIVDSQNKAHPQFASYYQLSASYLSKNGEFHKAVTQLNHARDILIKVFGKRHLQVAQIFSNLGDVKLKHGDLEGAKEEYDQAVHITQNQKVVNTSLLDYLKAQLKKTVK
ncbi:MAG: SEL1-like repeat protein [Candidatus Cloacimonetes bacterium]|nr:SEL1-like repeat protein [Candidatus Cloacimonadota bacterium]